MHVLLAAMMLSGLPPGAQDRSADPASLAAAGWAAVEERRFGDALDAFTRAADRRDDPMLHLGAGFAALMLGQHRDAEAWLERALALAPGLTDASVLLGEVLYRGGRLRDAIEVYEAALERAPGHRTLEQSLAKWRKDADIRAGSYESRGAHFSVRFQGPADDLLARRAVEMLEAAYWRVGAALATYPRDAIVVVLYTQEQFRDVTRSPAWAAAAYDGIIRVPMRGALARADDLERLLAHEFVHALVAGLAGRNVPQWLNEGLASYFESAGADASGDAASARIPLPLSGLEGDFGRFSPEEASAAYLRSAAAVRRIMQLRGPSAIVALLQDLGRGARFESAFQQRISMRYEDFQALVDRE